MPRILIVFIVCIYLSRFGGRSIPVMRNQYEFMIDVIKT